MGFGLLFIGYFMTFIMSVNPVGFLFRLAGYALMLYAFAKLKSYNRSFCLPMYSSIAMIGISALECCVGVGKILYDLLIVSEFALPSGFEEMVGIIDDALVLVFNAMLIYAIRAIAKETEIDSIFYSAGRNFFIILVYYLLYAIAYLPFDFVDDYKRYFSLPIYLVYFAGIILMLVLIFKCYANICDEADIDMPLKKSRFEFVNKFREETARREQKAADESVELARKKLEERQNKRKRR